MNFSSSQERLIELTLNQRSEEVTCRSLSLIARSRRSDFSDLQLELTSTQEQATHSALL
ncbi:MAG: hypothetical protein V7L20_28605 [Nostoc sp.]